jgi:GNAT superfamily N-acetyltransferase
MSEARIRLLTPADLPQAVRLSTEAGWNQTPSDWLRLLTLEPAGCFAAECDGEVAATATAVRYGSRLAWIGMVLTREPYRGRGLATRLMRRTLEYLEQAGVACVKLDATDAGRPLYERLGFRGEYPVERWVRDGEPGVAPPPGQRPVPPLDDLLPLDQEAFGADRAALLGLLRAAGEGCRGADGFALDRPGRRRRHFGPCVARGEEAARRLACDFRERHGFEPALWDLPPQHAAAAALAAELGFQPARRLLRMRRGAPLTGLGSPTPLVWALAGFEFG